MGKPSLIFVQILSKEPIYFLFKKILFIFRERACMFKRGEEQRERKRERSRLPAPWGANAQGSISGP